jgi:hypothetical protein
VTRRGPRRAAFGSSVCRCSLRAPFSNLKREKGGKTHSITFFQKPQPLSLFLGGFVVDDDGGGYVDIGEEDDWSVAADGAEEGGKGKQQKKGEEKKEREESFFSFDVDLDLCFISLSS